MAPPPSNSPDLTSHSMLPPALLEIISTFLAQVEDQQQNQLNDLATAFTALNASPAISVDDLLPSLPLVLRALSSPLPTRSTITLLQLLSETIHLFPAANKDNLFTPAIPVILKWSYWKAPVDSGPEAARGSRKSKVGIGDAVGSRSRRGSVEVGGVMGGFAPPSTLSSSRAGGQSKERMRSSSRSSLKSSIVGGGAGEPGDDESGIEASEIRFAGLQMLLSLTARDAKLLYPSISLLLPDSSYQTRPTLLSLIQFDSSPRNCLKAVEVLDSLLGDSKAFLKIADDRESKLSFTSLSAKLSTILTEVHEALSKLLLPSSTSSDKEHVSALLLVTSTLIRNTPYDKLSRKPLAHLLAKPLIKLIEKHGTTAGGDLRILKRSLVASNLLIRSAVPLPSTSSVKASIKSTFTSTQHLPDPSEFAGLAEGLLMRQMVVGEESLADLEDEIWDLINSCLERIGGENLEVGRCKDGLRTKILHVLETQPLPSHLSGPISFLVGLKTSSSSLEPSSQLLTTLLSQALVDPSSKTRSLACSLISLSPNLDVIFRFEQVLQLARNDGDSSVRSAACGCLGIGVKSVSDAGEELEPDLFLGVMNVLLDRCRDLEPTRSTASWGFANCCDVLVLNNKYESSLDYPKLIETTTSLVEATGDTEKAQTNGLRALGSILRSCPLRDPGSLSTFVSKAVYSLLNSLLNGPPKVRWNAATAIANTLSNPHATVLIGGPITIALVSGLSRTLVNDPNYKVRIQSCRGLMVAIDISDSAANTESVLSSKAWKSVDQDLEKAWAKLVEDERECKVGESEKVHFGVLKEKLDLCRSKLIAFQLGAVVLN